MTFAQFIKKRRLQLGLTQEELSGFGQSYIADIEGGRKNPLKLATIEKLAKALRLRDNQVDWLWAYALLDQDPYDRFGGNNKNVETILVNESSDSYTTSHEISIPFQATEKEILTLLGHPDKKIQAPSKSKWIYLNEGLHIVFVAGKVTGVDFK